MDINHISVHNILNSMEAPLQQKLNAYDIQ